MGSTSALIQRSFRSAYYLGQRVHRHEVKFPLKIAVAFDWVGGLSTEPIEARMGTRWLS